MNTPKAWLCVSSDGSQVDATASTTARDTYAQVGRTITPLYDTPPGPHAMTAQAGAVAYIKQSTLDKLPGCKYIEAAVFPDAGEDRTPLYTTPPAAVPVEALEGLVEALRNEAATIAKPYGFVTEHIIGKAEGLESCAERIERLIKERSNG